MDILIEPTALNGSVSAPPSKSEAHRLLICAALADKPTDIQIRGLSNDIIATINCLEALGARIEQGNGSLTVRPIERTGSSVKLNCGESGSTLRFLLPIASALYENVEVHAMGRLPERPISELTAQMERHGCTFSNERIPFCVSGKLTGGDFEVDGGVSSQFVSGLLLAAPLFDGDARVRIKGKLESSSYVYMTINAMKKFGVSAKAENSAYVVNDSARYRSPDLLEVGADWSNAAFWLCAGTIGGCVSVDGLDESSEQGDRRIAELLNGFGADISWSNSRLTAKRCSLAGQSIDVSQIPDLFPVLAAVGACAEGETTLFNARRLRVKESDRIASTAGMLNSLGIAAVQTPDSLRIHDGIIRGGRVDSRNDHRIAMAAAVMSIAAREPVIITGAEAVNKSYPDFFNVFNSLGGKAYVVDSRQST